MSNECFLMRESVRNSTNFIRLTRKKSIGSTNEEYSMSVKLPRAIERTVELVDYLAPETLPHTNEHVVPVLGRKDI